MAIADYSLEIAKTESKDGAQKVPQAHGGKDDKKRGSGGSKKDQGANDGEEDDLENMQLSMAESILKKNKGQASNGGDDALEEDVDEDEEESPTPGKGSSKSKKKQKKAKPLTDEEKKNIEYWAN